MTQNQEKSNNLDPHTTLWLCSRTPPEDHVTGSVRGETSLIWARTSEQAMGEWARLVYHGSTDDVYVMPVVLDEVEHFSVTRALVIEHVSEPEATDDG